MQGLDFIWFLDLGLSWITSWIFDYIEELLNFRCGYAIVGFVKSLHLLEILKYLQTKLHGLWDLHPRFAKSSDVRGVDGMGETRLDTN